MVHTRFHFTFLLKRNRRKNTFPFHSGKENVTVILTEYFPARCFGGEQAGRDMSRVPVGDFT